MFTVLGVMTYFTICSTQISFEADLTFPPLQNAKFAFWKLPKKFSDVLIFRRREGVKQDASPYFLCPYYGGGRESK